MRRRAARAGAGTFLSFTISIACFLSLFVLVMSAVNYNWCREALEDAAAAIARDVVVCGSMEEARRTAQDEAEAYFSARGMGSLSDPEAEVEFATADEEWRKGNYVSVYVSAAVDGMWFGTSRKTARDMVMIEHN